MLKGKLNRYLLRVGSPFSSNKLAGSYLLPLFRFVMVSLVACEGNCILGEQVNIARKNKRLIVIMFFLCETLVTEEGSSFALVIL